MKKTMKMMLCAAIAALGLATSAAVPEDATGTPIGAESAIGDVMVIDVSGGPKATTFPVSYYINVDMGYFNCDTYKTTKIVLRKVKAGTYIVGNAANYAEGSGWPETTVKVNKDYYIGLFPVTCDQFYWVLKGTSAGSTPCNPRSYCSYNQARSGQNSVNVKADDPVSGVSFMNLLRQKVFEGFDLPTEVQWEIAARAGQTGEYGWYLKDGVATQGTLQNVGDFSWNKDNSGNVSHPVGGKAPNLWGIYDTAGEEWEWCRDEWNGSSTAYHGRPAEVPYSAGGTSGNRVFRGGYFASSSNTSMRPSVRNSSPAADGSNLNSTGFRLCCIPGGRAVPADATGTPIGVASAVGDAMVVDVSAGANAATFPVSFPVSYYNNVDMGYFNCDTYKTTKIALRKVKAGSYTVGNAAVYNRGEGWPETTVMVNKDYYIGIFPVTWQQWFKTAGGDVPPDTYILTPHRWLAYDYIRSNQRTVDVKANDPVSGCGSSGVGFMDCLCQKAGAGFDLPTEVQWEVAARAGQKGEYGWYLKNGVATQGTLQNIGDFSWNKDNSGGTGQTVGRKAPNLWGIYDTAGNVWEWCRDEWNGSSTTYHGLPAETPYSAEGADANRILRGGWASSSFNTSMSPSTRNRGLASEGPNNPSLGFRVSCMPVSVACVVTLDAQGGTGGSASVTATYGEAMPTIVPPTKDGGFVFAGYFGADGKQYYNANGTSAANWDKTEATTIYAQWSSFPVVEIADDYRPTQIVNGDFTKEPWMDFTYNGKRYTACTEPAWTYWDVVEIAFNGVGEGWNTTETTAYCGNLFEYVCRTSGVHGRAYNATIPSTERFVEMNCVNAAMLYQDLPTHSGDIIRWSLSHGAKNIDGLDAQTQSMRVEIGAPLRGSDGAVVNATGTGDSINPNIADETKAIYRSTGVTDKDGAASAIGFGGSDIANLNIDKTLNAEGWWPASGVYVIPEGQAVTRFGFVSEVQDSPTRGNLLDNIEFSTLLGNLRLTDNGDGSATVTGYWGDADAAKRLAVVIGAKTYYASMGGVLNKNFSFVISAEQIGSAREVTVYHEDYPSTAKTIKLSITVTFDANGGAFGDGATARNVFEPIGEKYALPETPTRAGYTISGWFTAVSGGTAVTTDSTVTADDVKTLYAQWEETVPNTLSLDEFDLTTKTFAAASGTGFAQFDTLTIYLGKEMAAGDAVTLPTVSGYARDDANSTDYTIVINVSPAKTAGEVASEYLNKVRFNVANAQTVNAVLSSGKTPDGIFYFSKNGHYYQFVKYPDIGTSASDPKDHSWIDAYNAAKEMTYAGRRGYLATITDFEEDQFIYKASDSVGWLGGTVLSHGDEDGALHYTYTAANKTFNTQTMQTWYWACGPERGQIFFEGVGSDAFTANQNKGYYFNWSNGEPSASRGEECCLTSLRSGVGAAAERAGSTMLCAWNDVGETNQSYHDVYGVKGYFVEYGDQKIGDSHGEVLENRVSALGEIPMNFDIPLDAQGGTGGSASVTATYGAAMPTATMPTKAGYTFLGYFDATAGGKQYYNANGTSAANWDKVENTTLYAQWKGNPYKYILDGGSFTGKLDVVYGELPKDLDRVPVSEGKTFLGYFDEEEHMVYDEEGKYVGETAYEVVGDTQLKAEWGEEPEMIELIAAKQRWPWNGKIDIVYKANALKPERSYIVNVELSVIEPGASEPVARSVRVAIPSENGERTVMADFGGVVAAETVDENASIKLRLLLEE